MSQIFDQLANVTTVGDGVTELHAGELDSLSQVLQTLSKVVNTTLVVTQEQVKVYFSQFLFYSYNLSVLLYIFGDSKSYHSMSILGVFLFQSMYMHLC